eukprot:442457-Rhodomonas_salina.1
MHRVGQESQRATVLLRATLRDASAGDVSRIVFRFHSATPALMWVLPRPGGKEPRPLSCSNGCLNWVLFLAG